MLQPILPFFCRVQRTFLNTSVHNTVALLNLIWLFFFLIAFVLAWFQLLVLGDTEAFARLNQAIFELSKTAFEIAIGLTGVLAFWLGMMRIGEKSGFIQLLTRFLAPLFQRLMPGIPPDHPALGSIVMNISANMLGLDNAATPLGIKAMQEMQTLNRQPDTATNEQILFLVINTSAVTLFPVTIFTYRAQMGAQNPTDVFIPILIATYISTLTGLISVAIAQKIRLWDQVILSYLALFSAAIFTLLFYFSQLDRQTLLLQSALLSHITLFSLIIVFLVGACINRVNAYEAFVEGAKEGFATAVMIIPYLVAMLVAIGVFRASGALNIIVEFLRYLLQNASIDNRFVDGLPTALMKPFSGSGARAMMIDTMQTYGADSFAGRLASIVQGSTETTFYVLAVYFGAVGIKKVRHALFCGIMADFAGISAAIFMTYLFFG